MSGGGMLLVSQEWRKYQNNAPMQWITEWRKKEYQASYSVEAAWVFGISLLVIYMTVALSFTLYQNTHTVIAETQPAEFDAVKTFRKVQLGEELIGIE